MAPASEAEIKGKEDGKLVRREGVKAREVGVREQKEGGVMGVTNKR